MLRKVLVRIDISRFMMGRQMRPSGWRRDHLSTVCTFDEIGLEVCTEIVAMRARELSGVLRTSVPNVRVVEIHWVDDFPDQVGRRVLNLRASVLLPFTDLEGVQIRVRKVVMADKGRWKVLTMLNQVFEGSARH
jgi:hypothetical protein